MPGVTTVPLSPAQLTAAFDRWRVPWRVYRPDWATYNRNGGGRVWGPVNGFMVHNFASDTPDQGQLAYLNAGDMARGMPGPLSQFALDDAGVWWLIGWGRANHAGTGSQSTLDLVVADRMPLDGEVRPAGSTVDGNAHYLGVEMLYGKAPTTAQRESLPRGIAAVFEPLGWTAGSVLGHREHTADRSDPVGFDMGAVRQQVAALLAAGPNPTPPNPPKEDQMPTPSDLWQYKIGRPGTKLTYTAEDWLRYANLKAEGALDRAKQLEADLAKTQAQVATLAAAVQAINAKTPDPAALAAAVKAAVAEAFAQSKPTA